jgi:hypothetical protein
LFTAGQRDDSTSALRDEASQPAQKKGPHTLRILWRKPSGRCHDPPSLETSISMTFCIRSIMIIYTSPLRCWVREALANAPFGAKGLAVGIPCLRSRPRAKATCTARRPSATACSPPQLLRLNSARRYDPDS